MERINIIDFSTQLRNESIDETLVRSSFIGNETIQEFLNQYTDISVNDITQLGELGVASLIRLFNVSREDEGSYRCNASNELKIQFRIASQPIQVTVIGKHNVYFVNNYYKWFVVFHGRCTPIAFKHSICSDYVWSLRKKIDDLVAKLWYIKWPNKVYIYT